MTYSLEKCKITLKRSEEEDRPEKRRSVAVNGGIMKKKDFVEEMNRQVKLVRTEYGLTQEAMAKVMGLSKKTLVEIEKGRSSLGWTGAAAFAAIFSESRILAGILGGETEDIILALAFEGLRPDYPTAHVHRIDSSDHDGQASGEGGCWPQTMGGKIWWRTIEEGTGYRIQQNIISQHFRALDDRDGRICASFELEVVHQRLAELGFPPVGSRENEGTVNL